MVKIVTDSACDLPESLVQEYGIEVVPLKIRFDEEEFTDRTELTTEDFWRRSADSAVLPATAAPSPGAFEEAFRKAGGDGSAVVCINISSELSATFQSASTAAAALSDMDVRVVDSKQCTVAEGLLVLEAAKLAATGAGVDEVMTMIEELKTRLRLVGTLDTLENLRKGGRIGAAGAFFASLLSVKPLITIEDGAVKALSRQRTRRKALQYMVDVIKQTGPIDHIAVSHAQAPDIDEVVTLLETLLPREQILVADIGPVIGTHGGPRTVAVCYTPVKGT